MINSDHKVTQVLGGGWTWSCEPRSMVVTPVSHLSLLLKDQPGIIRTVPLARPSLPNIFCEYHTVHWEQQGFWILDPEL